jgi:hypothetical protein
LRQCSVASAGADGRAGAKVGRPKVGMGVSSSPEGSIAWLVSSTPGVSPAGGVSWA